MGYVTKRSALFGLLAALLTAGMLLLGDGMTPVWWWMWVAFVPVLVLAAESASWVVAGVAAFVSMMVGMLTLLWYLHWVLRAPVIAWAIPVSIASLMLAVGVLLFRGLLRRGAVFPAVISLPLFWTVFEAAVSRVPANGTAGSLAYTQEGFLPILQIASLTGPWGITFLLLLLQTAVASAVYLWRRKLPRARLVVGSAVGVVVMAIVFGMVRLAAPRPSQRILVGLVDTDAVEFADGPELSQLMKDYAGQAEMLAGRGAKIVVMPEKTGLLVDRDAQGVDAEMQAVADRTGATLVIGVLHATGGEKFNQARIYAPREAVATYDKEHMLPPFESTLTPGTSLTFLGKTKVPVGVAICKDMDFIHPALDYGRAGIDLLLDPAWDFSVDRTFHGHIAILRGVEGGDAIAHAAKFGFLTVTDDRGRILGEVRTKPGGFASLLVEVPVRHDRTVFDRWGTWFVWVAGVGLLGVVGRLVSLLRV